MGRCHSNTEMATVLLCRCVGWLSVYDSVSTFHSDQALQQMRELTVSGFAIQSTQTELAQGFPASCPWIPSTFLGLVLDVETPTASSFRAEKQTLAFLQHPPRQGTLRLPCIPLLWRSSAGMWRCQEGRRQDSDLLAPCLGEKGWAEPAPRGIVQGFHKRVVSKVQASMGI